MDIVKQLYTLNIGDITDIKKLSGGLSNEIYLINNLYIWKIFKNKYLFNHISEKKIIESSPHLQLYYFDDNNICYNYIKGNNIDISYFKNNLTEIINLTKKYHMTNVTTDNFWTDTILSWLNLLSDTDLSFTTKEILQDIYQKITLEINSLSDSHINDIVLCHHDVHPGNIIKKETDDLELIDLEFSFLNYYFVDLGNIICEFYTDYSTESYNYHLINDDIIKTTLQMYKNNMEVSNVDIKKIKLGIQISHFYWCVWGLIIDLKGSDVDFDYKQFAKERYQQLNFLSI